jgi:hypothetical protein
LLSTTDSLASNRSTVFPDKANSNKNTAFPDLVKKKKDVEREPSKPPQIPLRTPVPVDCKKIVNSFLDPKMRRHIAFLLVSEEPKIPSRFLAHRGAAGQNDGPPADRPPAALERARCTPDPTRRCRRVAPTLSSGPQPPPIPPQQLLQHLNRPPLPAESSTFGLTHLQAVSCRPPPPQPPPAIAAAAASDSDSAFEALVPPPGPDPADSRPARARGAALARRPFAAAVPVPEASVEGLARFQPGLIRVEGGDAGPSVSALRADSDRSFPPEKLRLHPAPEVSTAHPTLPLP